MPTKDELQTELLDDPAGLGYAVLVMAGNHAALRRLLLDTEGPAAASIPLLRVQYRRIAAVVADRILDMDEAVYAQWKRVLDLISPLAEIDASDPATQRVFARAVKDRLTTKEELASITQRIGSRAEVMWGEGASPTVPQIRAALSGP